ncbi:hypothetical protein [Nocardioides sp. PD653]|uniref:hypothetical protein n=1 Tax=Nocardioides sp. PD653 TaxID=393303 RepID=UPI0009F13591
MSNDDPGETWAAWLREQLDRHPTIKTNADLVRAGGLKDNGRPVIDASSVTQWLRGRRPSFELAAHTAAAFGVHAGEALAAAGYGLKIWDDEDDEPTVGGVPQDAGYVAAPGEKVEGGATNDDVLQGIREMREDMHALLAQIKRVADQLESGS